MYLTCPQNWNDHHWTVVLSPLLLCARDPSTVLCVLFAHLRLDPFSLRHPLAGHILVTTCTILNHYAYLSLLPGACQLTSHIDVNL